MSGPNGYKRARTDRDKSERCSSTINQSAWNIIMIAHTQQGPTYAFILSYTAIVRAFNLI